MNKLLLSLTVIFLLVTQACKKKEEEPAAPTTTYIESAELDNTNTGLNDLTTGTLYTLNDALQNNDKIDIAYIKILPYTNAQNQPDTAYNVILSPNVLTDTDSRPLFNNKSTFAASFTNPKLQDIKDAGQLKTLYDEAVTAVGRESTALSGMTSGATIMFKIRQQSSTPKYGGFVINSISSDSLKLNVSITVQK